MKFKISRSQPLPKQKEHRSKYDLFPIETLPVGGNFLVKKLAVSKGNSAEYKKEYSAIRNGMYISAVNKRLRNQFQGDVTVGINDNKDDPTIKEIRVYRVQ